MTLSFLLPFIQGLNAQNVAHASSSVSNYATEEISEENYIIGTSKDTMTSDVFSYSVSSQAPFDKSTNSMMSGLSFVPYYNSNFEVTSRNYQVNDFLFSIDTSKSIYMWIYFPDSPNGIFFDFNIKFFNSDGDYVAWSYDYEELAALFIEYDTYNIIYTGWKLIEFSVSDATTNLSMDKVTLTNMNISYILNENYTDYGYYKATDCLTIYSAYLGTKTSNKTIVYEALNYYYYAFSSSFSSGLRGLYVGESYTLNSISSVFSYVYVGKSNLALGGTQNNSFSWDISVTCNSDTYSITLPNTIYFDEAKTHTFSFKLTEYRTAASTGNSVFTATYNVSIFSFIFGSFGSSIYELQKGNSLILQFSLADNFVQTENLEFSAENAKMLQIVDINYDSQLGIYYIEVKALKKGSTNIIATAGGYREGGDTLTIQYKTTASVSVKYNGVSEWMKITLYVFLGFYLVAFIIFVIISFVNIRRNIVK